MKIADVYLVTYSSGNSTGGADFLWLSSSIRLFFQYKRLVCQKPKPKVAAGKTYNDNYIIDLYKYTVTRIV